MSPRRYRLLSFGVPFEITLDPRTFALADLRPVLPPGTRTTQKAASRRYHFTRAGGRVLVVDGADALPCATTRDAQDALEGDLALHVAANAPGHIFIHAGVVAWKGGALLLPGRTFAGKSTLVAALVAGGALYYSDEYAVLDRDGRVLPYPRRLSLRRSTGRPRRTLPAKVGKKPIAVRWVLGAKFEAATQTASLEPLSAGRTALLLLDNAVAARIAPGRVLGIVRDVSAKAWGAQITRGEARPLVKQLLPRLTVKAKVIRG